MVMWLPLSAAKLGNQMTLSLMTVTAQIVCQLRNDDSRAGLARSGGRRAVWAAIDEVD